MKYCVGKETQSLRARRLAVNNIYLFLVMPVAKLSSRFGLANLCLEAKAAGDQSHEILTSLGPVTNPP